MGKSRIIHQYGGNLAAFHGARVQKGYGLGNLLKGAFRSIIPLIKEAGKTVGRSAFHAGTQVLGDIFEGKNLKKSVQNRTSQAGQKLRRKAIKKAKSMIGAGRKHRKNSSKKRYLGLKASLFKKPFTSTKHTVRDTSHQKKKKKRKSKKETEFRF